MSPRRATPVAFASAVAALGVLALAPRSALAQCDYPFLGSGFAVYYPFGTNYYPTVVQSTNYWSVIAVRPDAGSDWDIGAHQSAVLFPNCVSGTYATSVRGGSEVDLVIGDFNHNPQGTFYVHPYHFSGGGGATIEWDDGADQLQVNGQRIERSTGPNDVVEAWDIFLEAGRNYSFDLQSGGSNLMTMLIYKNPANAPYWNNRNGAYWEYNQPANSSTIGGIVVDQTDWYGVVMINRNGGNGFYHLLIETCTTPTALVSGSPTTAPDPGRHYTLQQTQSAFTAVGARGSDAVQYWTVDLGETPNGVAPWCYATHRASSTEMPGKVSYVVGDFSPGSNPTGGVHNVRIRAPWATGGYTSAVEWDDGPDSIVVNAPPFVGLTSTGDVLACWNVALEAGYRYQVEFMQGGDADLKLALFDNPGGLYWVPRSSASAESDTTFYFVAPRTDQYGLVLSNDNGQSGAYQLAVKRCALTDIVSENANFVATPPGDDGHYELQVGEASWAAVSLLSTSGSQDWTLDLYADRVGAPPSCFSGLLETSAIPPGKADLIVGRPNLGGGGPQFFARARPEAGTSANAIFQWEQGTEALVVGGPLLMLPAGAGHNVQCWDVDLTAGVTYDFTLNRSGDADVRLLLFRPTDLAQDGAWKNRTEAEFDVTGNTSYLAPASGTYGVVAVDDNGATGSYELGVAQSLVAVDPIDAPLVTRLERIVPHPVAHDSRIHYALARAGDVRFEIVNAAGRRVAEIAEGAREAGVWSAAWSGRSADGRALASGVYFVRMKVDGVRVADARLVQLP